MPLMRSTPHPCPSGSSTCLASSYTTPVNMSTVLVTLGGHPPARWTRHCHSLARPIALSSQPEVLALPGLLDWWFAPHRFRIVLTHAHLLGTAMEYARTHPAEHVPLHDLRTHYLEQVRTHDFPADIAWDQVPDILFPLEYGQSWADPGGGHLRQRVEHANSTAFTQLRNSLTALSSAEARLAQTYHAYRVAAAVPQRHYQQEQDALRDVEERARRITEQIASRRDTADLLRQQCDEDRHTLCTANQQVATHPGPPTNSELRRALRDAQGDGGLHNIDRFRSVADTQLTEAFDAQQADWTAWAEPLIDSGILEVREVDRVRSEAREIIRTTLHDAGNAVRWAWRYQKILWIEFSPNGGNPGWATDEAVRVFEDGVRDSEHAYMKLVDQANTATLELEDRIEKDTARIDTHLRGVIADLHDLAEQQRTAEKTRAVMQQLRQQADSAKAREGEFDTLLEQARIRRGLHDLELLGQAETRVDRQLQALNHLLTLRTYDRIRGSR